MGLKVEWIRYGTKGHPGYFCFPERASGPLPVSASRDAFARVLAFLRSELAS